MCVQPVCLRACARRLEQVPHTPAVGVHVSERPPRLGAEKTPRVSPTPAAGPPWTQGSKLCRPHPSRPSPGPTGSSPLPWILSVTRVINPANRPSDVGRDPCHCRSRTSGPRGHGGGKRLSRISSCLMVLTLESMGPEPHCWVSTRAPPLSYSGSLAGSPKPLSLSFPVCETGTVTAPAEFRVERITGPLEGRGLAAPGTGGSHARVSSADT